MKKVLFGGLGTLILSLALIASPVKAVTNIASNGSFENGTDPVSFTTINSGDSTSITGWTVNSGTVDYIGTYWQASDGSRSVDLDGNSQGSISQTLTTVSGDQYTVTFDLSGNPDGTPTVKTVQVSATGGTPQNFTFDTSAGSGNTHANMMWATGKTYTFTANSTSTTLTFASQDAGDYGAVIDNVVVADTTQACNANATQTIDSDATTQYNGGNSTVVTPNVAWTASIPGASWVWGSNGSSEDTTVAKTDVFTKTFNITGTPTSGSLVMSADNGYVIKVNGHTVDSQNVDPANELTYQTTHTYDVSSYLQTGSNTLEIDVTNFGRAGTTFANNPGGLIYSLTVGNNGCTTPPPSCQETQSVAHVIYSDTTNTVNGTDGNTNANAVVVTSTPITTTYWTATVPTGAQWIWSKPAVLDGTVSNTETFTKTFSISGTPEDSSLVIAADNNYAVSVNGHSIDAGAGVVTNNNFTTTATYDVPLTDLVTGSNTLTVVVTNVALNDTNPTDNPAGLLYALTINDTECGGGSGGGGTTPPSGPQTTFHFLKEICPAYSSITGNQAANNLDATGGLFTQFANYVTDNLFSAVYGPKPIAPAEIPAGCTPAANWQFKLSTDQNQALNPVNTAATDSTGTVSVPFGSLSSDEQGALASGGQLWVSEIPQNNVATFGALRCYNDALNGDNLEQIVLGNNTSTWPSDVYCIAYNVKAPTSVSVHIFKYLNGSMATASSANNTAFPMDTTFTSTTYGNATNAPFTLSPTGWGTGDSAYEASFANANPGANYSAWEDTTGATVGASCDGTHPYALTGYSTGATLAAAQSGTVTTTVPSFTNLNSDEYVIVHNVSCQLTPPIKVHIEKYLDGAPATATSANNYLFPMTATWQAANLNGGASTSGPYTLGSGWGGATGYFADTAAMSVPAAYSTNEVTDTSGSKVVSNANSCAPGDYLLAGYKIGTSFSNAAASALITGIPTFTNLTSDEYVLVYNTTCPTTGTISGMKFNDANRDGQMDNGEKGIQGWTIHLEDQTGHVIATTTTDSSGNYSFTNLAPGTYKVREVHQKGWKRQTKNPEVIVISAGSTVTDVLFGNAVIKKGEKDDTDQDDNRDDQSGKYYCNGGKSDYQTDWNKPSHQQDNHGKH